MAHEAAAGGSARGGSGHATRCAYRRHRRRAMILASFLQQKACPPNGGKGKISLRQSRKKISSKEKDFDSFYPKRKSLHPYFIINLDPVPLRILDVDLLHPIRPRLTPPFLTRRIEERDACLVQVVDVVIDRRYADAEVIVLMMLLCILRVTDQMQGHAGAQAKPGVAAHLKRFLNRIEEHHLLIKSTHLLEILHIDRQVIEYRRYLFLRLCRCTDPCHKQ